ncbi:hypothetical protein U1Q18_039204 [Sarracenia purpurea var. burkii]
MINSFLSQTQARPINALKISTPSSGIGGFHFQGILQGLSLGAIKDSGPSPGNGHHAFNTRTTLGGVKNSGPSPGQGNKVVTDTHQ